ncbi:crotonyl-CoA carboxylase/reductase, partial [Streptomyces sp. NPDC014685]
KVGVLALAPREGLGVRDREMREKHLDAINLFRDAVAERTDEHGRNA